MTFGKGKIFALILTVFLISLVAYLPYTTYAIDSSASSNLIKQKLDELKVSIASRAAKIKEDLTRQLQNKVLAGFAHLKEDKSIQISVDGESRNIITNEYTDLPKKEILLGDYLIALGEIDDKNNLVARKVIVPTTPQEPDRRVVWGQIISVEKEVLKIRPKESTLSALLLDSDTIITSASKDLTLTDIKEGTIVVAVGTQKAGSLQTRFINVLANKTIKLPKGALATQSATPSAIKKK